MPYQTLSSKKRRQRDRLARHQTSNRPRLRSNFGFCSVGKGPEGSPCSGGNSLSWMQGIDMASSDIHPPSPCTTFGPEARRSSSCTPEGLAGWGTTTAVAAAAAAAAATAAAAVERGMRAHRGGDFGWSVRVEAPKSSALNGSQGATAAAAAAAAAGQRPVRSTSGAAKMPPLVRPEYATPVDDAVVVKRLTSQVRAGLVPGVNGGLDACASGSSFS